MKIKLVKSRIGQLPRIRATLHALGLTKINKIVDKPDNAQTKGMLNVVKHLVKIVE